MSRIVLTTIGSFGDLHPKIAIALMSTTIKNHFPARSDLNTLMPSAEVPIRLYSCPQNISILGLAAMCL